MTKTKNKTVKTDTETEIILEYSRQCFGFKEHEEQFFVRGKGYGSLRNANA